NDRSIADGPIHRRRERGGGGGRDGNWGDDLWTEWRRDRRRAGGKLQGRLRNHRRFREAGWRDGATRSISGLRARARFRSESGGGAVPRIRRYGSAHDAAGGGGHQVPE